MRLTVKHATTYHLDPARARLIQSLRMTPVSNDVQSVINWSIEAEGAMVGAEFTDGAGDVVSTLTHRGPVERISISVSGTVETSDTAGMLKGHKERANPMVYLRKTRMTAPGVGLQALAERLSGSRGEALAQAHDMAALVAETITYTPGATDQGMTANEALELGRGVCQDHAQVLIAVARIEGVPARYVTGYLHADASGEAHEASHAWVELYVPDLGWVGFDPANKCSPDEQYIRVGSGMDALDAAPIRGITLGGGEEKMDIQLSVAAQQ